MIVTLFVNPKQFDSAADLAAYPRTENEDAAKLAPLGAHLLYAPDAAEIYPDGFATTISVDGVSGGMCGAFRPGHFDGVATVVAKLFLQTSADMAFFGEKDFQQLHVVRRIARDLDIPITVVGCPTVREADGLALSSRNVRLRRPSDKPHRNWHRHCSTRRSNSRAARRLNQRLPERARRSFCRLRASRISGTAGGGGFAGAARPRSACASARGGMAWCDAADRQCQGLAPAERNPGHCGA